MLSGACGAHTRSRSNARRAICGRRICYSSCTRRREAADCLFSAFWTLVGLGQQRRWPRPRLPPRLLPPPWTQSSSSGLGGNLEGEAQLCLGVSSQRAGCRTGVRWPQGPCDLFPEKSPLREDRTFQSLFLILDPADNQTLPSGGDSTHLCRSKKN